MHARPWHNERYELRTYLATPTPVNSTDNAARYVGETTELYIQLFACATYRPRHRVTAARLIVVRIVPAIA